MLTLGKAAGEAALSSTISGQIKDTIADAKIYAEGRGFPIPVTGSKIVADIKKLIDISCIQRNSAKKPVLAILAIKIYACLTGQA